jgi:hypothetical protein
MFCFVRGFGCCLVHCLADVCIWQEVDKATAEARKVRGLGNESLTLLVQLGLRHASTMASVS